MRQLFDETQLKRLGKTRFNQVEWVERTASTNADLRVRAEQGAPEGIVRIADYQTHGRGRHGRKWESPPRASLLMSLLLRPNCEPSEFGWLTHMAGLAVADICQETTGANARLKWPNDVVVDDMKLAGVLAEVGTAVDTEAVVIGIGLNVSWPTALPPGFMQMPVSLKALAERATGSQACAESTATTLPDRAELLVRLLCNFDQRYSCLTQPDWSAKLRDEVKQRSATLGRRVAVTATSPEGPEGPEGTAQNPEGQVCGIAKDISLSGSLLVETESASEQLQEFTAGDIVHLRFPTS